LLKIKKANSHTKMNVAICIVTIFMALLTWYEALVIMDRRTVDWRLGYTYHEPSEKIFLVAITDRDLAELGPWPWPRDLHARIIDRLNEQKPQVIGYDTLIADPDLQNPQADQKLAAEIAGGGNVVLPVFCNSLEDCNGIVHGSGFMVPLPELMAGALGLGHIVITEDPDKVVRRLAPVLATEHGNLDCFSLAVAKAYMGIDGETVPRPGLLNFNQFNIPVDEKGLMWVAYAGKPGTFPVYSVSEVLNNGLPEEARDGIVLFGAVATGLAYDYRAPGSDVKISELEIHANAIDTILNKNFYKETGKDFNVAVVLVLGLLCGLIFPRLTPATGLVAALAMMAIYIAGAFYSTLSQRYIVQMIYPLGVVIISYITNVAYGYILERLERQKITRTFGKYVAPQVVQEILKSGSNPAEMKSRRQEVTVLFVDLSGFTPLSESLPPEQLVQILNKYLNMTVEIIFKYEGTVDKFIGDAVMVVFNAPMPVADHELKACKAALDIQKGIKELSNEIEAAYGHRIKVTVGINTGEVVVGNIGAKNRMEYAAIGDNVNIAARLQSYASGGQIIISKSTYAAVKNLVRVNSLGAINVKGKSQALEVYEVTGLAD